MRIHNYLAKWRGENGATSEDYHRYRVFCSNKLKAARKSAHLTYTISKQEKVFVRPQITSESIKSTVFLVIVLLMAEYAWAYGEELKAIYSEKGISSLRLHMFRRFSKAVKLARQLHVLCQVKSGWNSQQESFIYSNWMEGILQMEKQDWKQAQQYYSTAKSSIEDLSTRFPQAEGIFSVLTRRIDPSLRFCEFQLTWTSSSQKQSSPQSGNMQPMTSVDDILRIDDNQVVWCGEIVGNSELVEIARQIKLLLYTTSADLKSSHKKQ